MNKTHTPVFDRVAETYDSEFTATAIGSMQRKRVHRLLNKYISGNHCLNILEVNCGTGEDALWLAKLGHQVTATDISSKMIDVAVSKKNIKEPGLPVDFYCLPFSGLKSNFPGNQFDIIFSDFGGLNCIDEFDFKKLSGDFSHLLKPGGICIAVIMGRNCLWEIFYFLLKGRPGEAFRRRSKKAVLANVNGEKQSTYYYSPKKAGKIMKTNFLRTECKPVGLFIPPSYLDNFFSQRKGTLKFLNSMENLFGISLFSDFADHYFIVCTKPA